MKLNKVIPLFFIVTSFNAPGVVCRLEVSHMGTSNNMGSMGNTSTSTLSTLFVSSSSSTGTSSSIPCEKEGGCEHVFFEEAAEDGKATFCVRKKGKVFARVGGCREDEQELFFSSGQAGPQGEPGSQEPAAPDEAGHMGPSGLGSLETKTWVSVGDFPESNQGIFEIQAGQTRTIHVYCPTESMIPFNANFLLGDFALDEDFKSSVELLGSSSTTLISSGEEMAKNGWGLTVRETGGVSAHNITVTVLCLQVKKNE